MAADSHPDPLQDAMHHAAQRAAVQPRLFD